MRGAHEGDRADHGRDRHRQGADRARHPRRSPRARRPLVRVNCAALPEGLLASELFGHERGAFTGALERRKGRFELANGGTIFLDEIGELSPAMQVALLRVLQEGEFERVGGTETLKTDVRVVVATNRNLDEAVRDGSFRCDLLFRLNVIPILVPPLRERGGDIRLIAEHYASHYASKLGKRVMGLSPRALVALEAYPWPGNVRELQNVVERAVILASGDLLQPADLELPGVSAPTSAPGESSEERARIEEALRAARGRVSGADGAAARLESQRARSKRASGGCGSTSSASARACATEPVVQPEVIASDVIRPEMP